MSPSNYHEILSFHLHDGHPPTRARPLLEPATFYSTSVQTSTSCTNRPDICQCLVVQTSMDDRKKHRTSISMIHVALEPKLRSVLRSSIFTYPVNRGEKLVIQSCIMPGLHTYLVQELNVGTVSWLLTLPEIKNPGVYKDRLSHLPRWKDLLLYTL